MFEPVAANVPTWLLALLLIGGSPVLAVAGLYACRPFIKKTFAEGHNDVSGFIFATIGVIYAVILAFLVFAVWDAYGTADRNVAQESSSLIAVYRDAQIFPVPLRTQVRVKLLTYANLVVNDEWQTQRSGNASPRARDALTAVFRVFEHARLPPSDQAAYQEALGQLNDMAALRTLRILASKSSLPDIFWVLLVLGAIVTIGFSFLFYMENVRLQAIGVAILAAIIGAALLVIFEVNYPFTGDIHITPDGFQYAIEVMQSLGIG